jgi:predicted transcriptional regulator
MTYKLEFITHIKVDEWQRQAIEDALVEADDDDFASKEEVHAVLEKWLIHGG